MLTVECKPLIVVHPIPTRYRQYLDSECEAAALPAEESDSSLVRPSIWQALLLRAEAGFGTLTGKGCSNSDTHSYCWRSCFVLLVPVPGVPVSALLCTSVLCASNEAPSRFVMDLGRQILQGRAT